MATQLLIDRSIRAASCGDVATLRTLRDAHGVPWDSRVCLEAAANGHVDCLEFAFENGCYLTDEATSLALQFRRHACLRYLLSQYVSFSRTDMALAIHARDLDSVRILREYGCGWPNNACDEPTSAEVLRYMVNHGAPARAIHKRRIARHLLATWRAWTLRRGIFLYWLEAAAKTACAPGGPGRRRDREAFEEWLAE